MSGSTVTRDDLDQVSLPASTGTYIPVAHHSMLSTTLSSLSAAGFEVSNDTHVLDKDGARYFGVIDLNDSVGESETLTVGIRNSHDKAFSMGFCIGTRTVVCSNLMFASDHVIGSRHTKKGVGRYIDRMVEAIASLKNFVEVQASLLDILKKTLVTDHEAESLILRSFEQGIIGHRQLKPVIEEWRNPSHEEHRSSTRYDLMQAFTQTMHDRFTASPIKASRQTIELHKFLAV